MPTNVLRWFHMVTRSHSNAPQAKTLDSTTNQVNSTTNQLVVMSVAFVLCAALTTTLTLYHDYTTKRSGAALEALYDIFIEYRFSAE